MHSVKLIIVLIFTRKNLASGNSVVLESYLLHWLVIKKVYLEPCSYPMFCFTFDHTLS